MNDHTHDHSDGHAHSHSPSARDAAVDTSLRTRLAVAFFITLAVLGVELIGGAVSGSLALLSDAAHMATDVIGLGIALGATHLQIRFASREDRSTSRHTYGLGRLEILAALANAVLILVAAAWVVYSAVERLAKPTELDEPVLLAAAAVGLAANVTALLVLRGGNSGNLNLEGAYLEVVADAIGSIGVILGAVASATLGWTRADPLIAIAIGLWVLPRTVSLGRRALRILMEAAPPHVDLAALRASLREIEGVDAIHDLHVWTVASGQNAVSAHLRMRDDRPALHREALNTARAVARDAFGLEHSTFQVEFADDCEPNCD